MLNQDPPPPNIGGAVHQKQYTQTTSDTHA